MNTTAYYALWAGLFLLCAGLGFIPEPQGFGKFCLVLLSIGFFIPPALLLRHAEKKNDTLNIRLVRNLAFTSLVLTLVLIIANFMSILAPEAVGNILYTLLAIVSAPMICGQYWVVSLFGWACLMLWAGSLLKSKK
jgi:hypothetical protein